jgi:hypothetical protein
MTLTILGGQEQSVSKKSLRKVSQFVWFRLLQKLFCFRNASRDASECFVSIEAALLAKVREESPFSFDGADHSLSNFWPPKILKLWLEMRNEIPVTHVSGGKHEVNVKRLGVDVEQASALHCAHSE